MSRIKDVAYLVQECGIPEKIAYKAVQNSPKRDFVRTSGAIPPFPKMNERSRLSSGVVIGKEAAAGPDK